jgi:hypothetical protein
MNRILLPSYLEMARKAGLRVREVITEGQGRAEIHADLLAGAGEIPQEQIQITGFGLTVSR